MSFLCGAVGQISISEWINIVIAVGTIFAAWAAFRAAKETMLARKSDFLPVLSLAADATTNTSLTCTIRNIGRDLAREVVVTFPKQDAKLLGNIPVQNHDYLHEVREINVEKVMAVSPSDRLLCLKYKDLFGREVLTTAKIVAGSRPGYLSIESWAFSPPEK